MDHFLHAGAVGEQAFVAFFECVPPLKGQDSSGTFFFGLEDAVDDIIHHICDGVGL